MIKNRDFDDILSDKSIEGIVISVPAKLHYEIAIKSIKAKKNVYVEKPLALESDQALEMIDLAKKNNVKLMVGHLLQYHPAFIKLKELCINEYLGDIKYIYSNRLSTGKIRSDEDVMWSFAPHDISMILSLTKENPININSYSSNILQEKIADYAHLHMEFPNNLKAHIFVSWLNPFKEHKLTVVGSKRMAIFDDTLDWQRKLCIVNFNIEKNQKELNISKKDLEYLSIKESEPLKIECAHFVECVNKKIDPNTDGLEGYRVLKVLEKASL